MKPENMAPQSRRKPDFKSIKEELKFLKSFHDVKYFFEKISYVLPRLVETVFYSITENEHELGPFLDYWRKIVDHAIDGGKAVEAFIDPGLPKKPRTKRCNQLWERMAIYWNGDVAICGEDMNGDWIVGNLRNQSIQEVWSGEK